jgi:hypothetical protein
MQFDASQERILSADTQMREEIATTLLISMGKDIVHFEKQVDPATGIVHVDWMFVPDPNVSTKTGDSVKIKSHAVLHEYSSHVDTVTGSKYSYLLGCEAIDLASLMQHAIHVNSGMVNPDKDHTHTNIHIHIHIHTEATGTETGCEEVGTSTSVSETCGSDSRRTVFDREGTSGCGRADWA